MPRMLSPVRIGILSIFLGAGAVGCKGARVANPSEPVRCAAVPTKPACDCKALTTELETARLAAVPVEIPKLEPAVIGPLPEAKVTLEYLLHKGKPTPVTPVDIPLPKGFTFDQSQPVSVPMDQQIDAQLVKVPGQEIKVIDGFLKGLGIQPGKKFKWKAKVNASKPLILTFSLPGKYVLEETESASGATDQTASLVLRVTLNGLKKKKGTPALPLIGNPDEI